MTLGEQIQILRKDAGLSQEALGETVGVSRQSISKWESDLAIPELEKLIALSRLFHISVGALLGVEEDGPSGEELTEREWKALEAIVKKLTPPPDPPKPKKKWPRVLAAAAVIGAFFAGCRFSARMSSLESQMSSLQYNVNSIDRNVSSQIYGITSQVEEILEKQNRVTADHGYVLAEADLAAETITFRVWATPRNFRDGMTARFTAAGPDFKTVTTEGTEGEGQQFTAELTCPLRDDVTLSVVFQSGGESQNQVIGQEEGLQSQSLPSVYGAGGFLFGERVSKEGQLSLDGRVVDLNWEDGFLKTSEKLLTARPEAAALQLWRNGTSVWSQKADFPAADGTNSLDMPVTGSLSGLREGDVVLLSVQCSDQYGREWTDLLDCAQIERMEDRSELRLWSCNSPNQLPWEQG